MVEKKKKIMIVTLVLIALLIVIGVTIFFVNYQKDKKQTKQNGDKVVELYQTFKTDMSDYASLRSTLYETVFQTYLNEMKTNYESHLEKIKAYEDKVKNIEETHKELNKLCQVIYLKDEVDHKCEAYRLSYEQMNNYFVKDIARFNENIDKYNEWVQENDVKLEKYEMQTKRDYMDYNKDGTYFGKE